MALLYPKWKKSTVKLPVTARVVAPMAVAVLVEVEVLVKGGLLRSPARMVQQPC